MANSIKRGTDSARVPERHGATGEIYLTVGVHPSLKDFLADIATSRQVTLKSVVVAALEDYVAATVHEVS